MTIHHDKLAYGKLASSTEELSESQILEMLNSLNQEKDDGDNKKETPEKDSK